MYTLSFEKFTNPGNMPKDNIVLYVVRNKKNILYVGMSRANVWNRWFGYSGRITKNIYNELVYHDAISMMIVNGLPDSNKWSIDLWTKEECASFLGCKSDDLRSVESELIASLLPKINVIGNSVYDFTCKGDRVYQYFEYIRNNRQKATKEKKPEIIKWTGEILPETDIPF